MNVSEVIMFFTTIAFWQAFPLRQLAIYWVATGFAVFVKMVFYGD